MFTKNYYIAYAQTFLSGVKPFSIGEAKNYNGTIFYGGCSLASSYIYNWSPTMYGTNNPASLRKVSAITSSPSSSNFGVKFGNGTGVASFDDYKLNGSLVTGISAVAVDKTEFDAVTEELVVNCEYTITNNSSTEEKTIGEVGLFVPIVMKTTETGTSTSETSFLIEHTILENPLVIEPGGVGVVNYIIRVKVPTTSASA